MKAELKEYSDPSLQILNFLLGAGGTKSTTTQSSSIDPAVMAQINTLLGQQMSQITPEGISALIGAIFRQGAQQVPVLATQFAQSAGARANNNSPLNLANQQLQTRLADQAMQSLLTAQNQASATAARAADATRTTTSNVTNRARAPWLPAVPFLIGQIPNIKKGINGLMDLGSSADTGFGSVPGGSGGFGQVVNNPSAYIAPDRDLVGGSGGIDPAMFTGSDIMFDPGALLTDWQPLTDVASNASAFDFSGMEGFDLGAFFADGGLVSRKAPGYADGGEVKTRNTYAPPGRSNHIINSINVEDVARARYNYSSTQANRKALAEAYEVTRRALAQPEAGAGRGTGYRKFADGGQVTAKDAARENRNRIEKAERETPMLIDMPRFHERQANFNVARNAGIEPLLRLLGIGIGGYADGGMVSARGYADGGAIGARSSSVGQSTSAPGTLAINSSDAVFGPTPGAGNSGGPSPAVDPLAQLSEDVLSYFAVDEAVGNSGWSPDIVTAPLVKGDVTYERLPSTVQMGGEAFHGQAPLEAFGIDNIIARPTDYDRKAGTGAYRYNSQTGAKSGNMFIKPESNGMMDFLGFLATAASMAMGNPALAFARSVGSRTAMEGVKTGFKEGGEVDGPGTGTSDSIVARLSDGEYVVPADVVEMLGVEFFDGLRDAFHTPVSMQRYHASGTTRNEQR